MKLTDWQKSDLKDLLNHRGFKLMLELKEEYELSLLRQFKRVNLEDDNQRVNLNANQNYLKGIEDFIQTIQTQTKKIQTKKIDS